MEAIKREAIKINTIIERKIRIRKESIDILKPAAILGLISFSNFFVEFKAEHD